LLYLRTIKQPAQSPLPLMPIVEIRLNLNHKLLTLNAIVSKGS
jgi:hypothetical protein